MNFCHISDSHMRHMDLDIPYTDVIIHSGDIDVRTLSEFMRFATWYSTLPHPYKILVAGNHDFFIEKASDLVKSICEEMGIIYLENSQVIINGIKIYGSPIVPEFYNWAFMKKRGDEIAKVWSRIPDDIDILITHGPPMNILDKTIRGDAVGCYDLAMRVKEIKPKYHLFGHIHEGYGQQEKDGTIYLNSSCLDEKYKEVRKPQVFTLG